MKNTFIYFIKLSLLIPFLFQPAKAENPGYGIVNLSVINLRVVPLFSSEMGTQALLGTPVPILEKDHGWYKLMTPDGYIAWTTDESVKKMSLPEYHTWNQSPKLIIRSYFSVLRSKPSENSDIVSDVVLGDIVRYQGKTGKYFKILLPDGRNAYLLKSSPSPLKQWFISHQPSAKNIISMAKQFIGFPYLWGGTSVKGMDCSGFTKTCFYLNGVLLARDASQQAQTGEKIDITPNLIKLQPADLLFFGSIKEGKKQISHVAIYIGNGYFIHSSGTVHISSLKSGNIRYDAYNAGRLLYARRILTRINKDSGIISIQKHPFYR